VANVTKIRHFPPTIEEWKIDYGDANFDVLKTLTGGLQEAHRRRRLTLFLRQITQLGNFLGMSITVDISERFWEVVCFHLIFWGAPNSIGGAPKKFRLEVS
jgi:hypothetical protein